MLLEQIGRVDALAADIDYLADDEFLLALALVEQRCHLQSHLPTALIALVLLLSGLSFGRKGIIVYLLKSRLSALKVSISALLIQTVIPLYLIDHCLVVTLFWGRLLLTLFFKHLFLATNFAHQPTLPQLFLITVIVDSTICVHL